MLATSQHIAMLGSDLANEQVVQLVRSVEFSSQQVVEHPVVVCMCALIYVMNSVRRAWSYNLPSWLVNWKINSSRLRICYDLCMRYHVTSSYLFSSSKSRVLLCFVDLLITVQVIESKLLRWTAMLRSSLSNYYYYYIAYWFMHIQQSGLVSFAY